MVKLWMNFMHGHLLRPPSFADFLSVSCVDIRDIKFSKLLLHVKHH
jgi:hypothetical protein